MAELEERVRSLEARLAKLTGEGDAKAPKQQWSTKSSADNAPEEQSAAEFVHDMVYESFYYRTIEFMVAGDGGLIWWYHLGWLPLGCLALLFMLLQVMAMQSVFQSNWLYFHWSKLDKDAYSSEINRAFGATRATPRWRDRALAQAATKSVRPTTGTSCSANSTATTAFFGGCPSSPSPSSFFASS